MNAETRLAIEIGKLTIEKCTAEANLEKAGVIMADLIKVIDDHTAIKSILTKLREDNL